MKNMKLIMESWRSFLTEGMSEDDAAAWVSSLIVPLVDTADGETYKKKPRVACEGFK